jgi:hypothetical protein
MSFVSAFLHGVVSVLACNAYGESRRGDHGSHPVHRFNEAAGGVAEK